jgi:hypothetical protein
MYRTQYVQQIQVLRQKGKFLGWILWIFVEFQPELKVFIELYFFT